MKSYLSLIRSALVALALVAGTGMLNAQSSGTLSGKVSDLNNPVNLEGVIIRVEGLALATSTNRFGEYTLRNVPEGTHTVVFSYIGYATETRSITMNAGGSLTLDVEIGEKIVELETFVVSGRLVGTGKSAQPAKIIHGLHVYRRLRCDRNPS
jgi:hypothetical protein